MVSAETSCETMHKLSVRLRAGWGNAAGPGRDDGVSHGSVRPLPCHDHVMRYETVAEAYRDLEHVSGRLALIERLAALLAQTPERLLPVICYLGQGLIAPEFAGVDLGLAEKLAIRAVATATGASQTDVAARAADPGHPAGGQVPAPAGHPEPAAGHRHPHPPGCAGAGARGRPGRPAG